jgi:hypothetical protein
MSRLSLFVVVIACLLLLPQLPAQKLKVYILAGQSNMQGHAKVETIDYIGEDPATRELWKSMHDRRGKPRVAKNVWISYLTGGRGGNGEGYGLLTTGYGARRDPSKDGGKIGPEYLFGLTMSQEHKGPVLLIKCAWGGKSLHTDFRPPSAGPFEFDAEQLERFAKQGKVVEKIKKEKAAATGRYYRYMIEHVKSVLADPKRVVPGYRKSRGYELAGFVWFQGWNDMVDRGVYPQRHLPGGYASYSENMAHFIRDVRKELSAPKLPFVIGVMGVGGPISEEEAKQRAVHAQFRAAMAQPASLPEFQGNVVAVPTAPFWDMRLSAVADKMDQVRNMGRMLRNKHPKHANADGKMSPQQIREYLDEYRDELIDPEELAAFQRGSSNAGYHYLGSAKTMAQIGRAFAEALLELSD